MSHRIKCGAGQVFQPDEPPSVRGLGSPEPVEPGRRPVLWGMGAVRCGQDGGVDGGVDRLVCRVVVEVAGIDKTFDYLVPEVMADGVRVGTRVRVVLSGRRVGGWVVRLDVEPPDGVNLRPLAKVTGWGPGPDVIRVAAWAAWRWAGRPASFLGTASPEVAVRGLPPRPQTRPPAAAAMADPLAVVAVDRAVSAGRDGRATVVRWPPARDVFPLVEVAADLPGDTLVITGSVDAAVLLARRLRRTGRPVALLPHEWPAAAAGGSTVIGARGAAWGPAPDLGAVVVLDAHDEVHRQEQAPTWSAWVVGAERARLAGAPCFLVSPCPSLEMAAHSSAMVVEPSRADERRGWAALEVVDRRALDPLEGRWSEALTRLLRTPGRVVCVLNRKGRARLLACNTCDALAVCERCGAALAEGADPVAPLLTCPRCALDRPMVCAACGAARMKRLRAGVARVREELEALGGRPVGEVTGESGQLPADAPEVLVGTEAVLHRVEPGVAGIAFLDFDQELLAPRYRAAEEALGLLARASRLVGGREGGGRVLVQTRVPDHPVIEAALHADPDRFFSVERAARTLLGFPPAAALALISGADDAVAAYVSRLAAAGPAVEIQGPDPAGRYLLRAPSHDVLCPALAAVPRPPGRLRVDVDPLRT